MRRAYLSNISPIWRFDRQEALLRDALPGYPKNVDVFRDELDVRKRQRREALALAQRAIMLRATTGKRGETVHIASLAVLAWTQDDMMQALTLALARGATVRVLDEALTIPPNVGPDILHEAAKAFTKGRKAGSAFIGGKISGEAKAAVARAKAEKIRGVYGMPTEQMPWAELLRISGLTRNTIIKHLGPRKPHQVTWLSNQKRAAARTGRKEAQGT